MFNHHPNEKELLELLIRVELESNALLREILHVIHPPLPLTITFKELLMTPTEAGFTQVFTGTLAPTGSAMPTDATFTITSNDPAVAPVVDSTGLIVTVTYPQGWVESTTTPLVFSYSAASASNPGWSLSATIAPSAPPPTLPTSITFTQTT